MTRLAPMKPVLCVLVSMYSSLTFSAPETSTIDLRITDHAPGIADFRELFVSMASVSLHKAGSARREGWLNVLDNSMLVDIVPLKDGRFVSMGAIELPAERYDAIRIEFSGTQSQLISGLDAAVLTKNTTIKKSIDLLDHEHLALVIDLYAENQTDHHPKRYVVKVKEIRINEQIKRDAHH